MLKSHFYGTSFFFKKLAFAEYLDFAWQRWVFFRFRVVLSLKKFKSYWLPLLFWIGIVILGYIPTNAQNLGGRKISNVCFIYDFGFLSFLTVMTKLILFVLPKRTWIPEKLKNFFNFKLFCCDFSFGRVDSKVYWRCLRFFMKRYRVAMNFNVLGKIYVNFCGQFFSRSLMMGLLSSCRLSLENNVFFYNEF